MSIRGDRLLRYGAFLAEFHGAEMDVLHVVEDDLALGGPADQRRDTLFRLLYRSNELRKLLDGQVSPVARRARLILEVGQRTRVLRRMMCSGNYRIVVTERRERVPSADDGVQCSVFAVEQDRPRARFSV
jgi:hypothetical protein